MEIQNQAKPWHDASDLALAEQAQSASHDAFDELMRRYKHPVVNFVYRMLGNAEDADDVAQEVFVRAHRHLGDYLTHARRVGPSAKFSTWIFALARNAAIDRLRWRQRHPAESMDALPDFPAQSVLGVAEQVSAKEVGEHIATAVADLPEDQRTALVLSEYHGLSYAEISEIMSCSAKSVEARLYRAKYALRRRLRFLLE
jgi:RNA polymerase sigma-70 factor (ECF subfamily)